MRVLHAADIHLDSPMAGLARYDGCPERELRLATRRALGNLVELALGERADVLVIAGDVFDGDWTHHGTGAHYAREMLRLREAEIPVVTIAGNHDAQSKITKALRMPDNVRQLSAARAETVVFEELGLAVHGRSYPTAAVNEDLSATYPAPLADLVNVGLLHTCAGGYAEHGRYAPCQLERLREHGYTYWALGHIHARQILSSDPPVLFAGNLQGRHVGETGAKGATLLDVAADGTVTHEHRPLDVVRWAVVNVDAAGCADLDEALDRAREDLHLASAAADSRLLAARVRFTGATSAHRALVLDPERLRYELVLIADEVTGGQAWIEQVQVATTAPRFGASDPDEVVGILAEVRALADDEEAVAEVAQEFAGLAQRLPASVRGAWDPSKPATVLALLDDVQRTLPARLREAA